MCLFFEKMSKSLKEDLDLLLNTVETIDKGRTRWQLLFTIWASTQEKLSSEAVDNKGADQPAHLRSLISTFVISILESIISKLATDKM